MRKLAINKQGTERRYQLQVTRTVNMGLDISTDCIITIITKVYFTNS